ncbi:MAG TPA: cysteine hydrolase [Bradyrhizobium sp.]|jgi:ureidoacrylate peracid hydrolase
MHTVNIPEYGLAAARRRRDAFGIFDDISPAKTAMLVVDMQTGFMQPDEVAENPHARDIVPNINALTAQARRAGATVVYLRHTYDPQSTDRDWPLWLDHFINPAKRQLMKDTFQAGSRGHEIDRSIERQPQDLVVDKTRFSAFIQGSSDLHELLQARGIDTLVIAGTLTNVCCESTARDAMMLNYKVVFASDATAARGDGEHNGALAGLMAMFADVRPTSEILHLLMRKG